MYLGTIHPNLYKDGRGELKSSVKTERNLNVFDKKSLLFIFSFLFVGSILASSALAAFAGLVTVSDSVDRVNETGRTGIVLQFNVTNQAGSSNAITIVNITNATTGSSGYQVTNANATGNATNACTIYQNSVNCSTTGFDIPAGTSRLINLTLNTPTTGNGGAGRWTIDLKDSAGTPATQQNLVYTLALDAADIGFDISNELGNVTSGTTVEIAAAGATLTVNNFSITDDGTGADSFADGLVRYKYGTNQNISGSGSDTFKYNVTKIGYINVSASGVSWTTLGTPFIGVKPSGLPFGIKVTVQDELGNALPGATVNITQLPIPSADSGGTVIGNSTSSFNATVGGVQYFALPSRFSNVSIYVTASGFIDNQTFAAIADFNGTGHAPADFRNYTVNIASQATGISPYKLLYPLKVNVTDELGASGRMVSGVTFRLNTTNNNGVAATANQSSSNVYYFALSTGWTAVNITASKNGFIDKTPTPSWWSLNDLPINSTNQTTANPQMPFSLKITLTDELRGTAAMNSGATIKTNVSGSFATTTADNQSSNAYYFNVSVPGTVNISIEHAGYLTNTTYNTTLQGQTVNNATQNALAINMTFAVRVTDLCDELGGPGHCANMDGNGGTGGIIAVAAAAQSGGANSTYGLGDAFLNLTTGTYTINASLNGFINTTGTIRVNDTTQTKVVFNTTGIVGSTDNITTPLRFNIRVLSVFGELGVRNFTLNGTNGATAGAGVAVWAASQNDNVFYFGPYAYVNASTGEGTAPLLNASIGNSSLVNSTVQVNVNSTQQATVLFNTTNQLSAGYLGSALPYIIKVTVTDELSNALTSGVVFLFNSSTLNLTLTPDATSSNVYYFSNQSWAFLPNMTNLTVAKAGYINASNAAFIINASNQSVLTASLPFNLKVAANDELSQALGTVVNFTLNNTGGATPNTTSGAFAYYAVPINTLATGGSAYVNVSKAGYLDSNTSLNVSLGTLTQALANATLQFTVRVDAICDELGLFCFTQNGALYTDLAGGVAASGILTNYSGNKSYLAVPNMSATTITAFSRGFVNTTQSVIAISQNTGNATRLNIAFNGTFAPNSTYAINATSLKYNIIVRSVCDQLNITCIMPTGATSTVARGGVEHSIARTSDVNLTRYNNSIAYIPAPALVGSPSVSLTAFSIGYINTTQSVTPTGTSQVEAIWNSTIYNLNYSTKVTLNDELSQSTGMSSGVILTTNMTPTVGAPLVENRTFFRNSPNSNAYYFNLTTNSVIETGGANLTAKKDGYINTSSSNFAINASNQSTITLGLPFAVKITTKDDSNTIYIGATVQLRDASNNVFTVNDGNGTVTTSINNIAGSNTSGSFGDTNTSSDGYIYWALNQSNVTNNVDITTFANRNGYSDSFAYNKVVGYVTQLAITSANHRDTTQPAAATGVTAVAYASGGQINVTWTASSSDASYYLVYRNITLLGTSSTTIYTDSPSAGIYIYNVTAVDTAGNRAATNGTSSAVDSRDTIVPAAATSVSATTSGSQITVTWTISTSSDVDYYKVHRNNTLLTTVESTSYVDYPAAGIYIYNVTTVDTSGNVAASNGTSSAVTMGERTAPSITIITPSAGSNVTTTTPTLSFVVTDNVGGAGVNTSSIAINVSGLNVVTNCGGTSLNITCTFVSGALTDGANTTISVAAKDNDGNEATNASRNFGVNTLAAVTATLNTSDTSAVGDNTYGNGWSFTFNITLGSTVSNASSVNSTAVKIANWTRVGGTETIATAGNTIMNYTMSNGTAATAYVSHNYNTTDTIFPLQDSETTSVPINGTVTVYIKIPASTTPGSYSTTFTFGSYSVSLSAGGNPS